MLLKYDSLDLLNSSITDVDSGVRLFAVHTESFYTTERVYHPLTGTQDTYVKRRRTLMTDIHQRQVAEIFWAGRVPLSIRIYGETLDSVTTLFNGCDNVTIIRSSELRVPTRIGAVWVATRYSLEVLMSHTSSPIPSNSVSTSSAVALPTGPNLPFIPTAFKSVTDFILLVSPARGHTFSTSVTYIRSKWPR